MAQIVLSAGLQHIGNIIAPGIGGDLGCMIGEALTSIAPEPVEADVAASAGAGETEAPQ